MSKFNIENERPIYFKTGMDIRNRERMRNC